MDMENKGRVPISSVPKSAYYEKGKKNHRRRFPLSRQISNLVLISQSFFNNGGKALMILSPSFFYIIERPGIDRI